MNKKGEFELGKIIFGMLLIVLGIVFYLNVIAVADNSPPKTPEQIAQERREWYLNWYSGENKYCLGQGKELNDTYTLNGCEMIVCKNSTELITYQFCQPKDNSGEAFVGGLIVGHLLFR